MPIKIIGDSSGGGYGWLEFEWRGRRAGVPSEQKWLCRGMDAVFLGPPFEAVYADLPFPDGHVERFSGTTTDPEVVAVVREWWTKEAGG